MSTNLNIITIETINYALVDDVIKSCPIWCKGDRNGREFIKKKKIESKNFIYGRYNDKKWEKTNGSSNKYDKVLIKVSYLDKCENFCNEINKTEDVVDMNNVKKAPPIIVLRDEEKFYDDEEYMLEIETRGIREHDMIYFKVKDVAEQFCIRKLHDTLLHKKTKYIEEKHYKYFICSNPDQVGKKQIKVKELFLTYMGILRVLFASTTNLDRFITWATKTLFTVQMGTVDQKDKLASKLLGIPISDFNNIMLKPNTKAKIASIYFITFGTGKDLRKDMELDDSIDDTDIIGIYGYTEDLRRRLVEHKNKYKNITSANLSIKYYSFIDKSMLSKAEKDIKDYFYVNCSHLEYESEQEMVCIDTDTLKFMESHYQTIGKKYEGDHAEIIEQMKETENAHKLEISDYKLEISDYKLKIINMEKDLMEAKYKELLFLKEKELLEFKLSQYE